MEEGDPCAKATCSIDVLTQLRKKESDARWRANLANCFETLKNIIPINKRANKKQISKAYILESTSKHLSFLEKLLVALLQHDASTKDIESDLISGWVTTNVKDIKDEFLQCYIPYIQAESADRKYKRRKPVVHSPFAEVPIHKPAERKATKTVTTRKRAPKRRVVKVVHLKKALSANQAMQVASLTNQLGKSAELDVNRAVMIEVSKRSDQVIIKQPLLDVDGKHIIKVFKVDKEMLCEVLSVDLDDYLRKKAENDDSQCLPQDNEFSTEIIASNFPDLDLLTIDHDALAEALGSVILCTPEKIPDCDGSPCFTPINLPSPEAASKSEAKDGDKSLLCTEWMWQSDDEDQNPEGGTSPDDFMRRNESTPTIHPKPKNVFHPKRREQFSPDEPGTPGKDKSSTSRQKKPRTGQKCRRSLKSIYTALEAEDIFNFDGYLAFYQRERAFIEASGATDVDISNLIRQKWCSLSETEQSRFMNEATTSKVESFLPVPEQDVVETWEEFESDFGQLPISETLQQPELMSPASGSFQEVPSLSPQMSEEVPKDFMSSEDPLADMLVPSIECFTEKPSLMMSPLFDCIINHKE